MRFRPCGSDKNSRARCGVIETPHGTVQTPVFMPVGTQATVKAITPGQLKDIGVEAIMCNAYHLSLRPGEEIIRKMGGLHRFMGWQGTIVTDSGGFQVFSLKSSARISEEGVEFSSPFTGERVFFSPGRVMEIQLALGSDIMMPLDHCVSYPCSWQEAREAMLRTHRWAQRCCATRGSGALFGIVQGGVFKDLRQESAQRSAQMEPDGYALGGFSVGEDKDLMTEVLYYTLENLPEGSPRYLMGVGNPADILNAIEMGVDMFDCVLPTRNGRNGSAFTSLGTVKLLNSICKEDTKPLDEDCGCYTCRNFSRAYLRHLFMAGEILAMTLVTLHNLYFFKETMSKARQAILAGNFRSFKKGFSAAQRQKED